MSKLLVILIILSTCLTAQENSFSAKSFKVVEYNDDGTLNNILTGKSGESFGDETKIEGVHVEMFTKDSKLILTTPKCTYNQKTKACTSKEAVEVDGDGVHISGIGFDVDNESKKIFIRSKVKVVWKKAKFQDKKSPKDTK
jgi:lipopolysaccharide export system protein LptC